MEGRVPARNKAPGDPPGPPGAFWFVSMVVSDVDRDPRS